ncbi:MAG: hypothetical protein IPP17_02175 [Bacteroidetes bacterium]|nr:hypothetical protein [Bacteroidota bacterium]
MFTEIPSAKWRALVGATLKLASVSPWEWLKEGQTFGVQIQETGEKIYCSVMGQVGGLKALAIYPGKMGWKSYVELGTLETDTDPNEMIMRQRCIMVSFVPANAAEEDDLALLKHIGIALDATQEVPTMRSYRPGYVPQPPDLAEVNMLQIVLEKALGLLGELPGAPFSLPENGLDEDGKMLFNVQTSDPSAIQLEWLLPDSTLDFSPPVATLLPTDLRQNLNLPLKDEIWLLETFYLTHAAESEFGIQFYPQTIAFFDLKDQRFRGVSLLTPDDFPDNVGEVLSALLREQGIRPKQLVVSKSENLILMRPICKSLGIAIYLEKEINILAALREAVEASMDFSDR